MLRLKPEAHYRLSRNESRLTLAALGLLSGLLAGVVANLFRLALETPFPALGIADHYDDFESLPDYIAFLLPIAGVLLLALIFRLFSEKNREIGVTHVIDHVQNLRGRMPVRNAFLQFLGSTVALLSGQSCGREGPGIHLGAASSSALCQWLNLPNNATRLILACGAAASIGALFNTPIAGVIFAMEVILMEYTIAGFLPVILAAVSGAVVTQMIYGDQHVFILPDVRMESLLEIPYIILMGLLIGLLAGIFIRLQQYALSFSGIKLYKRLILAGVLTGAVAFWVPQIMGTGYDSLATAVAGEYTLTMLAVILICKLLVTPIVLGLGIPGGFIGSTLMMGGIFGALMGTLGNLPFPTYQASPDFYVLLGMCAMMGAVLQAPLAALMATLEISNNSNLILPAMLIIVISNLTVSEGFGLESIYQIILRERGIKTPNNMSRLLNRYAVSSILKTGVPVINPAQEGWRDALLKAGTERVILQLPEQPPPEKQETPAPGRSPGDVRIADRRQLVSLLSASPDNSEALLERLRQSSDPACRVSLHATLQQALDAMQSNETEYAYVNSPVSFGTERLLGFLGSDAIMAFYHDR